jgi:hypothetical protein
MGGEMRFSLLTMIALMMLILAAGVLSVRVLTPVMETPGRNIVIVIIDGSEAEDIDEHLWQCGSPNMNKLRSRGISFLNCLAPSPWYPSAAASLLTGLYPSEHGLTTAHAHLSLRAKTLAEECATAGYRTCAFVEENSRLACTGVLQGFQRIMEDKGKDVAETGLGYILRHVGGSPVFGMIEIDAKRCGGLAGIDDALEYITAELNQENFFENGVLVVCSPGSSFMGNVNLLETNSMREFLLFVGEPLCAAPGKVLLKPTSLSDVFVSLRGTLWGGNFHIRDSARDGRILLTEMALPLDDSTVRPDRMVPPYFSRIAWYDDLGFRCVIDAEDNVDYQDAKTLEPVEVAERESLLAKSRFDAYIASREFVEDMNIVHTAGLSLCPELAERLGGPWLRYTFNGHSLHAVEHFRMGEALLRTEFSALAVNEFRAAVTMNADFPEAAFQLAHAYTFIGEEQAKPFFRAFLEKFEDTPGQEIHVAEARRYLSLE